MLKNILFKCIIKFSYKIKKNKLSNFNKEGVSIINFEGCQKVHSSLFCRSLVFLYANYDASCNALLLADD